MNSIDITKLKHNSKLGEMYLKEVGDSLLTKKECRIYIPERFNERGLADIGKETYIIGIFALVYDNEYTNLTINAMIKIIPYRTNKVSINGSVYYEFYFNANSLITDNLQLVKKDTIVYYIYDEFISKGKVPWYLDYNDLGGIFDTAKYHADANVGTNREIIELIISLIARNPKNKTLYYRTYVNSQSDVENNPPAIIPLKSVIYAATNTLNRIAGSYMSDGIISALNNPADRTERIENLLRL